MITMNGREITMELTDMLPAANALALVCAAGLDGKGERSFEQIAKELSVECDTEESPVVAEMAVNDGLKMLDFVDTDFAGWPLAYEKDDIPTGFVNWGFLYSITRDEKSDADFEAVVTDRIKNADKVYFESLQDLYEFAVDEREDVLPPTLEAEDYNKMKQAAVKAYGIVEKLGKTAVMNMTGGYVDLDTVLNYSYLGIEAAKKIVENAKK